MLQKKALLSALITGAAILGFSAVASADLPGFYVGGDLGLSNVHQSDNPFTSDNNGTGLGAGAQFGYQFNPYVAAEAGYIYFHNVNHNYGNTGFGTFNDSYKEQAGDLVVKGTLPLNQYFSLYGKAGAAYVDSQYEAYSNFPVITQGGHIANANINYSASTTPIRPVYGVGVSYNITPNVSADLGWTRVQKNNTIPNADITTLGLTYHFG